MSVKKVFIDKKGMVYLVCPVCSEKNSKSASEFPVHQIANLLCSCGNTCEFQIEYRKEFRRPTNLSGMFWNIEAPGKFYRATVVDLSISGCCLRVIGNHPIQLEDRIRVNFKLDNAKRTVIDRESTVCRINGNDIGCQFLNLGAFDPDIGFYVRAYTTH